MFFRKAYQQLQAFHTLMQQPNDREFCAYLIARVAANAAKVTSDWVPIARKWEYALELSDRREGN